MAQNLDEQVNTIERALGERMIRHALIILRSWLIELGDDNPFEARYLEIRNQYKTLFDDFLTSEDPEREEQLNKLTGDTYRLTDDIYAAIRLRKGLAPEMHGFNGQNPQSIMHYWSGCEQFKESDFEWLRDILNDPSRSA